MRSTKLRPDRVATGLAAEWTTPGAPVRDPAANVDYRDVTATVRRRSDLSAGPPSVGEQQLRLAARAGPHRVIRLIAVAKSVHQAGCSGLRCGARSGVDQLANPIRRHRRAPAMVSTASLKIDSASRSSASRCAAVNSLRNSVSAAFCTHVAARTGAQHQADPRCRVRRGSQCRHPAGRSPHPAAARLRRKPSPRCTPPCLGSLRQSSPPTRAPACHSQRRPRYPAAVPASRPTARLRQPSRSTPRRACLPLPHAARATWDAAACGRAHAVGQSDRPPPGKQEAQ